MSFDVHSTPEGNVTSARSESGMISREAEELRAQAREAGYQLTRREAKDVLAREHSAIAADKLTPEMERTINARVDAVLAELLSKMTITGPNVSGSWRNGWMVNDP